MAGRRSSSANDRLDDSVRARLTQEAAKIMAVEGVHDFAAAKRKAAARLHQPENKHLPSNREIEDALAEYLRLFHAKALPGIVTGLLDTALSAMKLLDQFDPRLTGPLLQGVATPYSAVPIQVFSDSVEQVAFFLQDNGIPITEDQRRLRYGGDRFQMVTVYRFVAGETTVEITVLPPQAMRETPLSASDGRPVKRIGVGEVESLKNRIGNSQG